MTSEKRFTRRRFLATRAAASSAALAAPYMRHAHAAGSPLCQYDLRHLPLIIQ